MWRGRLRRLFGGRVGMGTRVGVGVGVGVGVWWWAPVQEVRWVWRRRCGRRYKNRRKGRGEGGRGRGSKSRRCSRWGRFRRECAVMDVVVI
jgi:hypothetical protein